MTNGKRCFLFTGFLSKIEITDKIAEVKRCNNKFMIELIDGEKFNVTTTDNILIYFLLGKIYK